MLYGVMPSYRGSFNIVVYEVAPDGYAYAYWQLSSDGRYWIFHKSFYSSCKFHWYTVSDLAIAKSEAIQQGATTCPYLSCDLRTMYPELFI